MSIPNNITKENISAAISKIDHEGIPDYSQSVFYDLVYKGKSYPPKLVISYANFFANGEILDRKSFPGGPNTQSFKILKDKGFEIKKKSEMSDLSLRVWIEKTLVQGRINRIKGDRAMGKVLWSPQKDKRGGDIYKNMRLVHKGDIILHLIDNKIISGFSVVNKSYVETTGLAETDWSGPAYKIELVDYTELEPPIERTQLLTPENKTSLEKIANGSEVFYNKKLDLRQGAYLTPCPYDLLLLINETYLRLSNNNLPFIDNYEPIKQPIKEPIKEPIESFNQLNFRDSLIDSGLQFNDKLVTRLAASLLTKPFVILTGLSGSGKTKLAQAFAMWICESNNQYCIVPVGADWTNREPLLGFPNALQENEYVKPDNRVLDLIIDANNNQDKPYFLILDEMNLSHVERYFADFLSVMESKSKISLHSGNEKWDGVPADIGFPKNLFTIGTVNIDETTYMFSPKVLDRANVIEFRVTAVEMDSYLKSNFTIDLSNLEGHGANMADSFVQIAKDNSLEAKETEELNITLMNFFSELKKTGAEFGYRSASEILRFAAVVNKIESTWSMSDIIDAAIMQKLLPKVHGSRRKLAPVLETLGALCLHNKLKEGEKIENYLYPKTEKDISELIKYPLSFEKISRMYRNLLDNGFTSYAEA
jgi:5-methylcytosine-specific restriction protein B